MWCQQDITFCDVPLQIGVSLVRTLREVYIFIQICCNYYRLYPIIYNSYHAISIMTIIDNSCEPTYYLKYLL